MNLHARPHPAALMAMVLLPALAGCGDLPMPFKDRPGATALRLAAPPPTRLAVPAPSDALLARDGAALLARDMAGQLDDQDVPAEAITPERGDWRLVLTASLAGDQVIPTYTVLTPRGTVRGRTSGKPVAASAWANADPATLQQVAQAAAPDIAAMLTGIQAAIRQADPNSLMHRPARIYFTGVTGAPGDGNASLTRLMLARLPTLGDVMVDKPSDADFTIRGEIKTAPGAKGAMRIEIQWIVTDAKSRESGRVVQINEVPAGSLDHYWGEVAEVVATEAAGGVHEVVVQASGRGDAPKPNG